METTHTTDPRLDRLATVRLAVTVDPLRLNQLVREIRAQAPAAEWATVVAFATELLAFAEAEDQGKAIAVVPLSALRR